MKTTKTFAPGEHSGDSSPLYVEVESPELERINAELGNVGTFKPADFEYHPHATLGYLRTDAAKQYEGMADADGITHEVREITISHKDGSQENVPLHGAHIRNISIPGGKIPMPATVMQKKLDAKFALKSADDATGEFEGFASTYSVDQDGERIAKGAWRRTLDHSKGAVPILFGHSTMEPAGWNRSAQETPEGLYVRGKLAIETEIGKKAYFFLKGAKDAGGRGGLSVGFRVIKDHWEKDPETKKETRVFDEVQLLEYSVVVFPCQLEAFVTEVKAHADAEISGEKSATRTVDGKPLGPEHFAYVGDPNDASTFKLPIHDEGHARAALGRFNQTDGIPDSEKPKVLARIHAAAKRFGIDVSDSSDGKSAAEIPNTKEAAMAQSHTDFTAALAQQKQQHDLQQERQDIEKALDAVLNSIYASAITVDEKKTAVATAYTAYACAMSEFHGKAYLAEEAVYAEAKAAAEKGLTVAAVRTKKSSMSAAKRAKMAHMLDMHKSALDLHGKAMDIAKKMMDGTDSDNDGDEMGAYAAAPPPETKEQDEPIETDPVIDVESFLSELPKFTLADAA